MAIDPQQRLAVVAPYDLVRAPELIDNGLWLAQALARLRGSR
jgi:hypothetical protein